MLWTVDLGRCALVAALAMVVLAGWSSLWLLATVGFLLGVGQTLFDSAALAIIPTLVSRDRRRLEQANGRLGAVMTAGQQLAGPPAGGVVFTRLEAICYAGPAELHMIRRQFVHVLQMASVGASSGHPHVS